MEKSFFMLPQSRCIDIQHSEHCVTYIFCKFLKVDVQHSENPLSYSIFVNAMIHKKKKRALIQSYSRGI